MCIHLYTRAGTDDDSRFPLLNDGWATQRGPWSELIAIVDRTGYIACGLRKIGWAFTFARRLHGGWLTVRGLHRDGGTWASDDYPPIERLHVDIRVQSLVHPFVFLVEIGLQARDVIRAQASIGYGYIDFKSLLQVAHVSRACHCRGVFRHACLLQQSPAARLHLCEDGIEMGE